MALPLANKSAIVTGAASGLGKAIAETFLKAGAKVMICDINEDRLKSASEELSAHGEVHTIKADITDEESVKDIFEATIEKFGAVDVLVNNAGIMDQFDAVGTLDKALWDRVLAVNLTAPMMMIKWAVNHMVERKAGVILNIGSMSGQFGFRAGKLSAFHMNEP
jgi:NAD(P)-dependent dehydrogenase (short-subunit alcohol dehydrogenase family)